MGLRTFGSPFTGPRTTFSRPGNGVFNGARSQAPFPGAVFSRPGRGFGVSQGFFPRRGFHGSNRTIVRIPRNRFPFGSGFGFHGRGFPFRHNGFGHFHGRPFLGARNQAFPNFGFGSGAYGFPSDTVILSAPGYVYTATPYGMYAEPIDNGYSGYYAAPPDGDVQDWENAVDTLPSGSQVMAQPSNVVALPDGTVVIEPPGAAYTVPSGTVFTLPPGSTVTPSDLYVNVRPGVYMRRGSNGYSGLSDYPLAHPHRRVFPHRQSQPFGGYHYYGSSVRHGRNDSGMAHPRRFHHRVYHQRLHHGSAHHRRLHRTGMGLHHRGYHGTHRSGHHGR
jgi:hypothetical protein